MGRRQKVVVDGKSSVECRLHKGVLQGSILGPLMFSLFINDLPEVTKNLKINLFADDMVYRLLEYVKKKELLIVVPLWMKGMKNIFNWCLNNCLILNEKKNQGI